MGWIPRLVTTATAGSATFLKWCPSGADIKIITDVHTNTTQLYMGSSSTMDNSTAFVELARNNAKEVLKDGLVQKMLVCAGAAAVGGISYLAWRKYGRSITRRLFQNEDDVEEDHVLENIGHEDGDDVNHDDGRDEDSEYSDGDDGDDDDVSDEESDTSYPDLETHVYASAERGDAATMFSDEEIDVPAMPATQRRVQRSRKRLVRAGRSRDYTD
ncbi:uncharacterized protein LOC124284068 [Haliotis rubra]|uniref:uncharacterized protein LOC124284068 n=1 Tax=Haliotis rubra TaxID=36100 RepID=UPI001EE5EB20|nr:uncharacterized protein LOC124284068 [Haliotis rubra]